MVQPSENETSQQNPTASAHEELIRHLPGTWHLGGYYFLSAPQLIHPCEGDAFALITTDSLKIYENRYVADALDATPKLTAVLTTAYGYTPLPPATLVVGSDTVRLNASPEGLCLEGSGLGVLLKAME